MYMSMCRYPSYVSTIHIHAYIFTASLQSGNTALMIAADYSDSDAIAALLTGGADCNLQNEVILAKFMTMLQL